HPNHGQADESAGFAGVGCWCDPLAAPKLPAACHRPGGLAHVAAGLFVLVPQLAHARQRLQMRLPKKRLKLAGGDRLKEAECCAPGGARTSSNSLAPAGESPAA